MVMKDDILWLGRAAVDLVVGNTEVDFDYVTNNLHTGIRILLEGILSSEENITSSEVSDKSYNFTQRTVFYGGVSRGELEEYTEYMLTKMPSVSVPVFSSSYNSAYGDNTIPIGNNLNCICIEQIIGDTDVPLGKKMWRSADLKNNKVVGVYIPSCVMTVADLVAEKNAIYPNSPYTLHPKKLVIWNTLTLHKYIVMQLIDNKMVLHTNTWALEVDGQRVTETTQFNFNDTDSPNANVNNDWALDKFRVDFYRNRHSRLEEDFVYTKEQEIIDSLMGLVGTDSEEPEERYTRLVFPYKLVRGNSIRSLYNKIKEDMHNGR